jgi:hypothetical protein
MNTVITLCKDKALMSSFEGKTLVGTAVVTTASFFKDEEKILHIAAPLTRQ